MEQKPNKYKTYYMELELLKRLDQYAKSTSLKKSTIINMALKEFLSKK